MPNNVKPSVGGALELRRLAVILRGLAERYRKQACVERSTRKKGENHGQAWGLAKAALVAEQRAAELEAM